VGTSLESLLKQPLPLTLAELHALGVPLWVEFLLLCLCGLAIGTMGAVAGWFVGGFVTGLAESKRSSGYRALFIAIALPILLISAPLFVLPRERDTVTTVLGVIAAPIVAAALCYRFHHDGWPESNADDSRRVS